MDFHVTSKNICLEAMFEETEWYSLGCRCRSWRTVLPVNWLFVGTQMLPMFSNGQIGPWPGKTQHHSHVMDLGRRSRVLLRNNSDLCIFPIHSLTTQKKLLVRVWSSFILGNVIYVNFGVPLEGSKRINIPCTLFEGC